MMLQRYNTIIFDFDGVIANTNKVKRDILLKIGSDKFGLDEEIVEKILNNKPINRYNYIQQLNLYCNNGNSISDNDILEIISQTMSSAIIKSERCFELCKLKKYYPTAPWLVISAGDRSEIIRFLEVFGLIELFDGGVFGNELTKKIQISNLILNDAIFYPVLSIGDSISDYEISKKFGFDFLGITEWSDCRDLKNLSDNKKIKSYNTLDEFIIKLFGIVQK